MELNEKLLVKMAKQLPDDWEQLGVLLGLTWSEIQEIDKNYKQKPLTAALDMLVIWKDKNEQVSGERKVQKLDKALRKLDRYDLCKYLDY